jgi:hypothetical protein
VAVAARARTLTAGEYVTDDKTGLLYVLEVDPRGKLLVEDVKTLEVYRIKADVVASWRVVRPDGS